MTWLSEASPITPISCLNFAIYWRHTEIGAPESKLREKSTINTQIASGTWNYWLHIAFLPPLKEKKVTRWDVERIWRMGRQCDLKLVQSFHRPCWIVTLPIT
jgi:hypothetical protein